MSYQVAATCYATPELALRAIAAQQVGTVVQHGGGAWVLSTATPAGGVVEYTLQPFAGGAPVTLMQPIDLQPCALLDWQDATQMGGQILAVWVTILAIVLLRRAVSDDS